ncbi:putative reverse transcriptase domain-containing protein [Tanacetum coccineum]
MAPKRTSTSAAPAMTQAAIRQLVAAALEAQAANMANTDNTNRNSEPIEIPTARKGTNDHKRKFDYKRNTTTNSNNNNYSNNRNNNNYQDNHNNHNRNNDYRQQQNRRQETIRTYAVTRTENKKYTKKYHGNLPLCTRCTLHHTRVCIVKCQTCNKVGHLTRNYRSKGPATGSNLLSVVVTCHACGEEGHYKNQC